MFESRSLVDLRGRVQNHRYCKGRDDLCAQGASTREDICNIYFKVFTKAIVNL